MNLKVKKIHPDAIIPRYAHLGDAGFDVCSVEACTILPGQRVMVDTGLAYEIPEGYALLVWDKSGIAKNSGVTNLAGVIDAGFRGNSSVLLYNLGTEAFIIEKGQKIAQMLLQKVEQCIFEEVVTLSDTTRGDNGWGSTGK